TTQPLPTTPPLPPIIEPDVLADVALADVVDVGRHKPRRPHDEFLAAAITDINAWLVDQLPDSFGIEWTPLEGGIWAGYPGRDSELPGCGEPVTRYEDLIDFAAFYCEFGDFMVYDDGSDGLIVALSE